MTQVEFDITKRQLETLGWEKGELVRCATATWLIRDITNDGRLNVIWVTMEKLGS